jgi:eukaryotic-like serine/threonine-protein kinase
MLKAITGRPLWVNVLVGIVLAIGLFALFLLSLNWLTGHGKSSSVPSVTGKTYEEARSILKKAGFDVEIQDSVYVDTVPALHVIKQIPEADEVVKSNRTVFLVIRRAVPPEVEMPNLSGYSFRNAEMVLKSMDLRVGDTTFRPDFARNAVLDQLYNGAVIKPGTKIRKGSVISLVLGDGIGNLEFPVPIITGMTYCDAKAELESRGLSIGAIVLGGVADTCSAFIYKQVPGRYDEEKHMLRIRSGQTIDIWLQADKPVADTAQLIPE